MLLFFIRGPLTQRTMAIYRSLLFSLLLIPLLEAHTLRVPVSWEEEETPDDSLVSVMFYGESQCPFCRKFVEVWQTIWTDPGFRKVVDYDFIPWGNAYFATTECGQGPEYNSDERHCWAKKCGGREFRDDDDDDDDDCFGPGPAIYQHSKKEGEVDIYESCVKKILGL